MTQQEINKTIIPLPVAIPEEDDWLQDAAPNGGFCDPEDGACESCQ